MKPSQSWNPSRFGRLGLGVAVVGLVLSLLVFLSDWGQSLGEGVWLGSFAVVGVGLATALVGGAWSVFERSRQRSGGVSWQWVGWSSPDMRLSMAALGVGVCGWVLVILGGFVWNATDAGLPIWLAGGALTAAALTLGVKAFRTRERWVSGVAILISVYPGVFIPLWVVAASFGAAR